MNNPRQAVKRKLQAAEGNLDQAMVKLVEVGESYQTDHPEITEVLSSIAAGILVVQEAIENLRAHI